METRFVVDRGEVAGLTIDDLDVDRYPLDDSDTVGGGADRRPRAGPRRRHEPELAGSAPDQHAWLRAGARAHGPRAGEPTSRLPHGRTRASRAVLQPDAVRATRSPTASRRSASATSRTSTRATNGVADELVHPPGVVRPRLPRLQRARLGCDQRRLADAVGAGHQRPPGEAGAVPVVRHRPVSGRPRRPRGVGGRRATRRRPATRTASGSATCNASCPSGLRDNDNYVRNSVKAVVDAYSGEVTFYVVDDQDPILAAWRSAFPNLFTPVEQMPAELREHLRYPGGPVPHPDRRVLEVPDRPGAVLPARRQCLVGGPGAEPVADELERATGTAAGGDRRDGHRSTIRRSPPSRTPCGSRRTTRCSTRACPENRRQNEFVLFRPFVPFSTNDTRTQLQAYMTASSDPETYGKLTTLRRRDARRSIFPTGRCAWPATPSRPRRSPDGSRSTTSATAGRRCGSATCRSSRSATG